MINVAGKTHFIKSTLSIVVLFHDFATLFFFFNLFVEARMKKGHC